MAKDLGSIIGLGVAAVGGWWLYNNWSTLTKPATPAPAPAPPPSSPTVVNQGTPVSNPAVPATPVLPAWMLNLDALRQQLQTMGGSPNLNIDQWVFQYDQLRQQRNMPQLTGPQVAAILAVNPVTAADRSQAIPASEFVNDIFGLGYGLQGVRRWARFNPIMRLASGTPRLGYRRTA